MCHVGIQHQKIRRLIFGHDSAIQKHTSIEPLSYKIEFKKIYPRDLKMHVGGKRVKALSIDSLCDWAERA